MPEGRMLKKRISDSKKLGQLKSDSARLLYTWLLPHLDVEGRYSADPDLIKGHIFPKVKSMTYAKIERLLLELAEIKLIILYRFDGEIYLQLEKFHDYQKIDKNKEALSKIEAPNRGSSVLTLDNSGVDTENLPTSKVKGSKGKLKNNAHLSDELLSKEFNEYYNAYPVKRAKEDAFKAFKALRRKGIELKTIADAFNGYMNDLKIKWKKENFKQNPMYPATFLRDEKWKDFIGIEYKPDL